MSDSTDDQAKPGHHFNPKDHIKRLCESHRVSLGILGGFSYPEGWRKIIEDMVREVSGCDLMISEIKNEYGRLWVHFYTEDPTAEIKMWRAINGASIHSKYTCEDCGKDGRLALHGKSRVGVLCDACVKKNDKKPPSQRTGTWLDYF